MVDKCFNDVLAKRIDEKKNVYVTCIHLQRKTKHMKQVAIIMMLILCHQLSFSQYIEKLFVGQSLSETIAQGKTRGYELVEEKEGVATFSVVNEYGPAKLLMFASPKSQTVWIGTSKFSVADRKSTKKQFYSMKKAIHNKHGEPYEVRRKRIVWDKGESYVVLSRKGREIRFTVVSPEALCKVREEF